MAAPDAAQPRYQSGGPVPARVVQSASGNWYRAQLEWGLVSLENEKALTALRKTLESALAE